MSINPQHNQATDQFPPKPENLKTKEEREEAKIKLREALPPGVFIKPQQAAAKKRGRPKNEVPKVRHPGYWTASLYDKIEAEAAEFDISVSEYVETLCVYARNVLNIGKKRNKKAKK